MKRHNEQLTAQAVVLAAGSGSRMGAQMNKQFLLLHDIPVLAHTLIAFDRAEKIDAVVVVTREQDILLVNDLIHEFHIQKVSSIVPGGDNRQASSLAGLQEVTSDLVLIHDGARPLIAPELINQTVAALHEADAAAVGIAVKDTLKTLNADQIITGTVDRTGLAQIQTPQGFRTAALRAAHENALIHGLIVTDDCALVENTGLQIRVVPGSALNIKITTPEDLVLGEAILQYIKENEA